MDRRRWLASALAAVAWILLVSRDSARRKHDGPRQVVDRREILFNRQRAKLSHRGTLHRDLWMAHGTRGTAPAKVPLRLAPVR
jgi:hypothetical protein